MNRGVAPEERLLNFDRWLRHELRERLDWAWAGEHKDARVEQCRVYIERLVIQMWQRGWMIDGRRLAAHLTDVLDRISFYQRQGNVESFWPYFQSVVNRYVGTNAEEIKAEALSAHMHISQIMRPLLGTVRARDAAICELVAKRKEETLREKLAKARKSEQLRTAGGAQLPLL